MFSNDFNMWEEAKARALKHKEEPSGGQKDAKVEVFGRPSGADDISLSPLPQHQSDNREISRFTKSRCSRNEHVYEWKVGQQQRQSDDEEDGDDDGDNDEGLHEELW